METLKHLISIVILLLVYKCSCISAQKIDCLPLPGATKSKCEAIGCVWSPVSSRHSILEHNELPFDNSTLNLVVGGVEDQVEVGEPWCFFPSDFTVYKVSHVKGERNKFLLWGVNDGQILPESISSLILEIEELGSSMLRFKIRDKDDRRFKPELPELIHYQGNQGEDSPPFDYNVDASGHLIIKRRATGAVLFNTDLTKLLFANQLIQITTTLSTPFVYGLGEHFGSFLKLADKYRTYSFYNRDRLPLPDGQRSYGGFPFYINLEEGFKNAHGVYLHNSAAMDIIIRPDQAITFRPIGGILDFVIFAGPTPMDVIKQYQNLVGLPALPPRWSLGFHLCRYNYGSLHKTEMVWNRTRASGIPFDVQWNDIDNMDKHNDFTYDHENFKDLPRFIQKLHSLNMHYMILFDPGVSQEENYYPYELGKEMDIFVKNATNQTLVGKVWNDSGRTVFPDFSDPKAITYWSKLFDRFQQEIAFDGAWIDMNDISSFVDGSIDGCPGDEPVEKPIYVPGGEDLQRHTLCASARHRAGLEYDVHNLYSFYEAIATFKALEVARPNKRPFIISRSTAPGQGRYSGHWNGDVLSTWDYLRWSIPSLIEHTMYGFPMMGSDICGFSGNTTEELCARWSTLGAFYTFTRNHNDDVSLDQDPVAMGPIVRDANINALTKKYSLIPYLYTLMHRAHKFGEPPIRSVPLEFYSIDKEALKVEYQFMWGEALMISPIVEPNTFTKSTYLPPGRWFEVRVAPQVGGSTDVPKWIESQGQWHESKEVGLTDIVLFYRAGFIIPIYSTVRQTIPETVNQPIGLKVVLSEADTAKGEIYLDDGDNVDGKHNYVEMQVKKEGQFATKLELVLHRDEYKPTTSFGRVSVYGIDKKVQRVEVNGEEILFSITDHVLSFELAGRAVSKNEDLIVRWVSQ